MRITAIISEYNPFHNGHKFQIDEIKKSSDAVVAIMSGNFLQRGDAAILDKWERAKTALGNGVDLVVELPVHYALSSAEGFAYGGVMTADAMGVIDTINFGSESGDISELMQAANLILEKDALIKNYLDEGLSYPSAAAKVVGSELPDSPNNILAIEYIKAIIKNNLNIVPETIKRVGAGYNEVAEKDGFMSASGIRRRIMEKEEFCRFVPKDVYETVKNNRLITNDDFSEILRYSVLKLNPEGIARINGVSEGLENKIYSAVYQCKTFSEICDFVKSKRYPMSRIKRILFSVILDLENGASKSAPEYIRVLGMNNVGKQVLKEMRQKAKVPVIVKTADFSCDALNKDIFATDIYNLKKGCVGADYKTSPVIF